MFEYVEREKGPQYLKRIKCTKYVTFLSIVLFQRKISLTKSSMVGSTRPRSNHSRFTYKRIPTSLHIINQYYPQDDELPEILVKVKH